MLHEACSEDIRKKCQEDLKRQEEDEVGGNPLLGKVIRCLKREEVDPSEVCSFFADVFNFTLGFRLLYLTHLSTPG